MLRLSDEVDFNQEIDVQAFRCKRLWAAVFRQGCVDAAWDFATHKHDREHYPEAWLWLNATDDEVGSFIWLCDLFDLDPDRARSQVRMKFRELMKEKNVVDRIKKVKHVKASVRSQMEWPPSHGEGLPEHHLVDFEDAGIADDPVVIAERQYFGATSGES